MSRQPVGLVPAAGVGRRMGWWASKELYPVRVEGRPVPLCHVALDALRRGGVERAVVVISDAKTDVPRVLGDGANVGLSLAYVLQTSPDGLPGVVRRAQAWLSDSPVAMVLPDTFFSPRTAIRTLLDELDARSADVVLGVFPTDRPTALAPVGLEDGWATQIQDKPSDPVAPNTWGAAVWSPRFTRFCAEWDAQRTDGRERVLSRAFTAARDAGLRVAGIEFEGGRFLDGGTPDGIRQLQRALDASPGVLVPEMQS